MKLAACLAAAVLAGCAPKAGPEAAASPVPEAGAVVHGYEAQDGSVVRYAEVETGGEARKEGAR